MDSEAIATIVAAAEQQVPTDSPNYRRMTDAERVLIIHLADQGFTQTEIAQRLNRSQSTISDWLSNFADSTSLATRYLKGNALRMARNIVETGEAKEHNVTLKGIGVLQEQAQQGLVVQIGGNAGDVKVAILVQTQGELSPPAALAIGEGQ